MLPECLNNFWNNLLNVSLWQFG